MEPIASCPVVAIGDIRDFVSFLSVREALLAIGAVTTSLRKAPAVQPASDLSRIEPGLRSKPFNG